MKQKLLLEVKNLKKYYPIKRGLLRRIVGWIRAVDNVSFSLQQGETLGLVGESGCGKTSLAYLILRLIEPQEGSIYFAGQDLTKLSSCQLRSLRKDIQIVFQDPTSSLDPRFTVGEIIQEGLHQVFPKEDKLYFTELTREALKDVGLPHNILSCYPHEFSGGQRQRISIARALVLRPKLLILDEPVSSLDVSIQAQILNLLVDLQQKFGLTYLFIAHNLRVIEYISDRIIVMYLGKIVEMGKTEEICNYPLHPYTRILLSAIPSLESKGKVSKFILKGEPPNSIFLPPGCRFHPRCVYAKEKCKKVEPALVNYNGRLIACHYSL